MSKEFLDEMRLEFDRRTIALGDLNKKAKNLMTIAGIISALLLGFNTPFGSIIIIIDFPFNEIKPDC